ncbi:unnamed protein product [Eruca vesicaria subsp. sativa]|uniref:Protein kinase domain-containing protein n=1 Tax=Eruca vesicaria subsp. sativa TaxID=29727 RepID=A0ABC8LPT7_ERUVS|nr:unnamed protein product [Eruca vesicaria subsp. sativa]
MRCKTSFSSLSILLSPLLVFILTSNVVSLSSSCQPETCGSIKIPYPFGIQEGCYLNEWYKIECRNATFPFLSKLRMEVVDISLPEDGDVTYTRLKNYGSLVRVKVPITSVGCSRDGNESTSPVSPYFIAGSRDPIFHWSGNSIVAVGCNSKASLTNIGSSVVGCELSCTANKETLPSKNVPFFDRTGCSSNVLPFGSQNCVNNEGEEKRNCDGNGCCRASLPDDDEGMATDANQVIGVRLESFDDDDGNSTSPKKCRVAFLTDEVYMSSNATEPERFFAKGYAIVKLGWVIQRKNLSFVDSSICINFEEFDSLPFKTQRSRTCICKNITVSGTNYTNCGCNQGHEGNPYHFNGCKGVGAGFGVLVLVGGIWLLKKILKKRRMTLRKRTFFKRNGGILLQQQLKTRDGNFEKTRIFTSRELEKATENFSDNRILGQGGQGTVYKGMLVDGRTVAVKKSKAVDEDQLEEFINEVVILSQVNHRHVVKLWGCCLETEVPVLVYEFIPNGNLFQHIHEETDDYTMIWGVRLRIAVDIAGALSYLHSAANSPIYHRDVKSTNVLLDEKYRAKVSDFGTSRTVTVDHTHWTTVISGTVGYVDPEYYGSSQYTDKSDVYSFGVILVELITGEKPVITLPDSQEIRGLADYFRAAMKENKFFDIMDARIRDACKPEQVMAVANLARKCLNSKGKKRPYMREVFTELEKIYSFSEDSLVKIENEDGDDDDEEEEGMNMIEISDSWTIALTAPAPSIVPSSSLSDLEPLFPPPTW